MDWITSGLAPLYTLGVKLYNYMLGFSLGFGLNTPQGASSTAWAYVSGTLFPFFQAIAATMLNLFFYIGICRQVGNLTLAPVAAKYQTTKYHSILLSFLSCFLRKL